MWWRGLRGPRRGTRSGGGDMPDQDVARPSDVTRRDFIRGIGAAGWGSPRRPEVTFYRTSPSTTAAAGPVDRFVLQRPRSDSEDAGQREREPRGAVVG